MSDQQESPREHHEPEKSEPGWWARIVDGAKGYLEKHRTQKQQESTADRAARRTADATLWIALFTAATVGIGISHYFAFHGQLDAMRGQLEEMRSASLQTNKTIAAFELLASASKETADATKESVRTSAETARQQLRAYITVEPLELQGWTEPSATVLTITLLRNSGQTPAYNISAKWSLDVFDYPFPFGGTPVAFAATPIPGLRFLPTGVGSIIGPGREVRATFEADRDFTDQEISESKKINSRKRLAIIGVVYYTDIFGAKRYSRFCHVYEAIPNVVAWCSHHNDAN